MSVHAVGTKTQVLNYLGVSGRGADWNGRRGRYPCSQRSGKQLCGISFAIRRDCPERPSNASYKDNYALILMKARFIVTGFLYYELILCGG